MSSFREIVGIGGRKWTKNLKHGPFIIVLDDFQGTFYTVQRTYCTPTIFVWMSDGIESINFDWCPFYFQQPVFCKTKEMRLNQLIDPDQKKFIDCRERYPWSRLFPGVVSEGLMAEKFMVFPKINGVAWPERDEVGSWIGKDRCAISLTLFIAAKISVSEKTIGTRSLFSPSLASENLIFVPTWCFTFLTPSETFFSISVSFSLTCPKIDF